MMHDFIRLTVVSFSSDSCQTKKQQLSKFNYSQTNKVMYNEY